MSDQRVWVVTAGWYEDRDVHSVWASEEEARAYADRLEEGEAEEFPIRSGLPKPVSYWEIIQDWPDSEAPDPEPVENKGWSDDHEMIEKAVPVAGGILVLPSFSTAGQSYITVHVWGTDRERVVAVFAEKWAEVQSNFDSLVEAERRAEAAEEARLGL